MRFETAAKLLEEESEGPEKKVAGEFWIDDQHYRVRVSKLDYLSQVSVEMEPGDMGAHIYGENTAIVEDRVDISSNDRSLVYLEGYPEIPSDDSELEAYVRAAFDIP